MRHNAARNHCVGPSCPIIQGEPRLMSENTLRGALEYGCAGPDQALPRRVKARAEKRGRCVLMRFLAGSRFDA